MISKDRILAHRVEDFNIKRLDTRVLVFFGILLGGTFFIYVSPEDDQEAEKYDELGYTSAPWSHDYNRGISHHISSSLQTIAENTGYLNRREHTKNDKKKRQYLTIRTKKIVSVVKPRLLDVWQSVYGFSEKETKQVFFINQRLKRHSEMNGGVFFNRMKANFSDEEFSFFLSDMQTLPPAHCIYVLKQLAKAEHPTFNFYLRLVKDTPDIVKRCRYQLVFDDDDVRAMLSFGVTPRTRAQYFFLYAIKGYAEDFLLKNEEKMKIAKKMCSLDIDAWHAFKEFMHIRGPYSLREMEHMFHFVIDGHSMHEQSIGDSETASLAERHGIQFVQIKGSPKKMVQRAIYNHRQERVLRMKKLLDKKNEPMPLPPVELPEWIENIRLKTVYDMIAAGIECDHCIGSYVHSNDVFVREGHICAQIRRYDLSIVQCYDVHDRITGQSKDLRKRLEKSLVPLAKEKGLLNKR